MRQIIFGNICMLQDDRYLTYDKIKNTWSLNEVEVNKIFSAVSGAGANGVRLIPWGVWGSHPHGLQSQLQPYILTPDRKKYDLGKFNDYYFPLVRKIISIGRKYKLTFWWAILDNCQFAGGYAKWSPWVTNVQGITTCYDAKAYPFIKTWIEKCFDEFSGLGVCWSWGNEMNKSGMAGIAKNAIFPMIKKLALDPKKMTYGATMADVPYINGEYTGNAGMLDTVKKITGDEFGDKFKLSIWKEVHGVGGKGYPKIPNRLHQALTWWARKANNGIRIWLSDDGVWDGDSKCDIEPSTGHRRPSAARWVEIAKMTMAYGNDFTYELSPKTQNINCIITKIKAVAQTPTG